MPEPHRPLRGTKPTVFVPKPDVQPFDLADETLITHEQPQAVDPSSLEALPLADEVVGETFSDELSRPDFEAQREATGTEGYDLVDETAERVLLPVISSADLLALIHKQIPGHRLEGTSKEILSELSQKLSDPLGNLEAQELITFFRECCDALTSCLPTGVGTQANKNLEVHENLHHTHGVLHFLEERMGEIFTSESDVIAKTFMKDVLNHLGTALPGKPFFNSMIAQARECASLTLLLASGVGLRSEDTALGQVKSGDGGIRERLEKIGGKGGQDEKPKLTPEQKKQRTLMGAAAFEQQQREAEGESQTEDETGDGSDTQQGLPGREATEGALLTEEGKAHQAALVKRAAPTSAHSLYKMLQPTFGKAAKQPAASEAPLWIQAAGETGEGKKADTVHKRRQDMMYTLAQGLSDWATSELKRVSLDGEFSPQNLIFSSTLLEPMLKQAQSDVSRMKMKERICHQLLLSCAQAILNRGEEAITHLRPQEVQRIRRVAAQGMDRIQHDPEGSDTVAQKRRDAVKGFAEREKDGLDSAARMRLDRWGEGNQPPMRPEG